MNEFETMKEIWYKMRESNTFDAIKNLSMESKSNLIFQIIVDTTVNKEEFLKLLDHWSTIGVRLYDKMLYYRQ